MGDIPSFVLPVRVKEPVTVYAFIAQKCVISNCRWTKCSMTLMEYLYAFMQVLKPRKSVWTDLEGTKGSGRKVKRFTGRTSADIVNARGFRFWRNHLRNIIQCRQCPNANDLSVWLIILWSEKQGLLALNKTPSNVCSTNLLNEMLENLHLSNAFSDRKYSL